MSSDKSGSPKTAKQQFDECMVEDTTPIERLRFFCSLTFTNGQDWLDVEPFFDAVEKQLSVARSAELHHLPEGCTPTDAMVLREANGILAEENHNLRRCLRFYANGDHYTGLLNWEGPSGDDNWLCPPSDDFGNYRQKFIEKMDEAMVEDGSVARATLISGKFKVESPEDEPKVIKGEPEWQIEQAASARSASGTSS